MTSIGIVCLLVIGGFVGYVSFESNNARGTNVSGIVYDGSGGPWTPAGSPYIVVGDVTVPAGETLTIEPGVQVKFDGYYSIYVDGILMAIGTESDRINFTSNLAPPSPGNWDRIEIDTLGHAEIKYCNISYAFTVIRLYSSNNNIINNNLWNNNFGVDVWGSSNNNITSNDFYSNDAPCIQLYLSSNNIIANNNLSNNYYWGLSLVESSNITITNNNISNNGRGISLADSLNITITNNNFVNDGVCLMGHQLSHFNSHHIPDDNIINGKPLLYYKDSSSINIDGIPVGQVILANCSDIEMRGLQVNNVESGIQVFYSNDIIIANNNISSNNLFDILLLESPNNTIINNNVLSSGINGIHLDSSSNNNIVIKNNLSSNNQFGIIVTDSSNNKIIDNYVCNNGLGIGLEDSSSNNTVINNNISNNDYGIGLAFSPSENVIKWNTISSNNEYGIYFSSSANNNIIRNNNISNGDYGIYVHSSNSNMITDNIISNNNNGCFLQESSNNTITNNNISNNGNGICLLYSFDNNVVMSNTIILNSNDGIMIYYSSNNNITGNYISDNYKGVNISQSSNDNLVEGNTVSNNGYGFYIDWTSDNFIYHNNIINNTIQAYDETVNGTQWDNGYSNPFNPDTDGGNYWSDFDEPGEGVYDDYKGPNQDDPISGDGIVDNGTIGGGGKNPYVIDSDSQDNYPLINPVDILPPTITNLQPPDASITNDGIPTISANYSDPSGINVSSVVLKVDGIDITSFATVTAGGVIYIPITALSNGIHMVYLEVKDTVDNLATATWFFTVITALPPATNLTTKVVNNGNNVELEWDPPSSLSLDHYLIYRADSATEFDFTTPHNISTTWPNPKNFTWIDPDPSVTAVDDDFYYIVRAANFDESIVSLTSNTAGVWTRTFESGISTFSLPLEPFVKKDTEFYCQNMNASYIKWMNQTTHTWMRHVKGSSGNNTLVEVGEGYEIGFLGKSTQTRFTFTGLPGAMILYDNVPFGFDATPLTGDADSLTAKVDSNGNVTLNWTQPANIGSGDQYHVLRSTSRDGFWGTLGVNYTQLAVLPFNVLSYQDIGNATPGTEYYYMILPVNLSTSERGVSSYSIGVWTAGYLDQYDTFGIPLKLSNYQTVDWCCDNIPDTVGINYYIYSEQRWGWHSTRMPAGAFDPILVMTEGYQISTSGPTKFTFIGV